VFLLKTLQLFIINIGIININMLFILIGFLFFTNTNTNLTKYFLINDNIF
jgi:hypothetical protein